MGYRPLACIALIFSAWGAPGVDESLAPAVSAPQTLPPAIISPSGPQPEASNDVRIVIDTSGSMKQSDPENLRIPALKLLVNLLPTGTRAGVWLFDSKPRQVVAVAPVDKDWKEQAVAAAARIDSTGAFTHIESALSAAITGWSGPAQKGERRQILLLTDGKVDISKNRSKSAASRERILKELMPALQQAGIVTHTIALSDKSDKQLMRQLAFSTGGWSVVARNADELQRAFIEMFHKAAAHDSIPIRDNRFTVDTSVEEFTLFVLLKPGAASTRLTAPDGGVHAQAHLPNNTRWLHESGYDLITVSRPAAGDWKLEATADPANQVFVVTHLKMEAASIPNDLPVEEKPEVAATFTEQGHPITREDFLGLLAVRADLQGAGEKRDMLLSRDPARAATFSTDAGPPLAPGEYTLRITADGKTFQRESRQSFRVMPDLLRVETMPDPSSDPPGLSILLTPNPNGLTADSLTVQAALTDRSGQSQELTVGRVDSAVQFKLPVPARGERWIVNFNATGRRPDGEVVQIPVKPLTLGADTSAVQASEHRSPPVAEPLPRKETDWRMTTAIAVGINVLLLGGILATYRIMKKRSEATIARLLSKLSP